MNVIISLRDSQSAREIYRVPGKRRQDGSHQYRVREPGRCFLQIQNAQASGRGKLKYPEIPASLRKKYNFLLNLFVMCRLRAGEMESKPESSTTWISPRLLSAPLTVSPRSLFAVFLMRVLSSDSPFCADIVKFFGCELGAQTKFDKASGTSIVNGAHETKKLEELLEGFIKRYVQCSSCNNPETTVKIRKDNIFLKCKACGATSDVDMRHKLNTYILKNPPEDKISKAEKKCVSAFSSLMLYLFCFLILWPGVHH